MRSHLLSHVFLVLFGFGLGAGPAYSGDKTDGWISLFNGTNLDGWKLRSTEYTVTTIVDAAGKEIKGAKKAKVEQKEVIVDAKGKPIETAKVVKKDGKGIVVDADGKPLPGAKPAKVGGRDALVGPDGMELKDARILTEKRSNPTGGWKVSDKVLTCGTGPRGVDLFTEQKFQDFELHVEFLATSNSGVYLQGRYEIQIDNSLNVKPKVEEKDGTKVESLPKTMCGALYSQIAPAKNMAKSPKQWQTFDITFRAPRGEKGKVTKKAWVTVVWNGETVIDAEIPNGTALDPGPILLQGDHGLVSFRNIRIRPLEAK